MVVCEVCEGMVFSCFEDEVREVDKFEEEWEFGGLDLCGDLLV